MNLSNKESPNNIINNNYNDNDINIEGFTSYIIDSKNKLKIQEFNKYKEEEELKKYLDQKEKSNEEDMINKSISTSSSSSSSKTKKSKKTKNNSKKLMSLFIEKYFPCCNRKGFSICKKITTEYFKKYADSKTEINKIEECINYIEKRKRKWSYSSVIELNLEIIQNIGYILMMTYNQFSDKKINDIKALKENIKRLTIEPQDPLSDFYNFFGPQKLNPDRYKRTEFWEKNPKKYFLPAIFLFLINSLQKIETININFEINKDLSNKDIDFLAMIIYNVRYIFENVNHIKFNMMHNKLQSIILFNYLKDYKKALNGVYGNLKKQYIKLDHIYDKKWDFTTDFLFNEQRQILKNESLEKKKSSNEINKSKTSDFNIEIDEINNKDIMLPRASEKKVSKHSQAFVSSAKKGEKLLVKKNTISSKDIERHDETEEFFINNPDKSNGKLTIDSNNFKFILLLLNSLKRFKSLRKLELIINDSYYPEFYKYFERILTSENKSVNIPLLKDFNIIDLISSKLKVIDTLNLEINSLDHIFFKKVLQSIYINESEFMTLNLSFFSSDVSYLPQSLFKLYNPMNNLLFKGPRWREDSELKILGKLLDNFRINLQMLFNLIKYKKIPIMGFNFDIPDIIENRQRYMIVITKFIFNLLLYISNKDTNTQKCIILAPKIKFNNNIFPFINQVLGKIDVDNNNGVIKELSFQVQLYQIINIKNIISDSLIILNIGDCDIYTFKALVNHLTSFRFSSKSFLSKLSISFIKSLRILNKEIYNLLHKIYNIKISKLIELNIYSNIIINDTKEYLNLLRLFKNNWISSCILTLNEKSKKIYELKECVDEKNKIKYFVPDNLENQLLDPDDKQLRNKINNNKIITKSDNVYWYLKYIFKIRYSCVDNDKKNREESLAKFLTNNILSYIHFQKNINISHNLKDNKE